VARVRLDGVVYTPDQFVDELVRRGPVRVAQSTMWNHKRPSWAVWFADPVHNEVGLTVNARQAKEVAKRCGLDLEPERLVV
jgi:hypothetical protein